MAGSKVFIGHVLMAAHAHMPSVTIAPGVEMPMLAFGTSFNSFKSESCSVQDMVEQFLALGGRHVDTAYDYHTQCDVGRALASTAIPREELFITTKLDPIGRQEAVDLVNRTSLAELGLDYIDLVLIHFPCQPGHPDDCGDAFEEDRLETWKGLMDLREAGVIRAAGVSNWNAKHIQNLVDAGLGAPAVNQVEWHLGYHDEDLFSAMATNDVKTMAWSALAGPTSQAFGHPGISLGDPELKALAAPYNASTAEVALRWSTQRGVTPVTSSCSASHVASSLASFDLKLSDDDIAALDALTASGAPMSIVETAQAVPALSSLVGALVQADLVDALSGDGPFTVFAPTNDAFDAISSVVEGLTKEHLQQVLEYHVVSGAAVKAGDLTNMEVILPLFSGHSLGVDLEEDGKIARIVGETNAVTVTTADVLCTNGVVHIVDAVLIPKLGSVITV